MAESTGGRKVYLTRGRKRSFDAAGSSSPESNPSPISSDSPTPIIDLTHDDSTSLLFQGTSMASSYCEVKRPSVIVENPAVLPLDLKQDCEDSTESSKQSPDGSESCESDSGSTSGSLECAICLQCCVHPARLPCGHIFCFLCIKGVAHGNRKCAMCRAPIPHNYFSNPQLLESPEKAYDSSEEGYEWFYEGRHGWWQYDPRTSEELEKTWLEGRNGCELLIAGYVYIIDFREMVQLRKGQPSKRRRIKRDFSNIDRLGVAGIRETGGEDRRLPGEEEDKQDNDEGEPSFRSSSVFDFLDERFAHLSLSNSLDEDDDDDDDSYQ